MNDKETQGYSLVSFSSEKKGNFQEKIKRSTRSSEELSLQCLKRLQEKKVIKGSGKACIKNKDLRYSKEEKVNFSLQIDTKNKSKLQEDLEILKSGYSTLESQYLKLQDEKAKQVELSKSHMKTLQIIKKKIRSLLSAPSNPFQYPDSSTETNSLSSFQPFHKTRSLDLDNQFSKESHNLKTLKLQKDFECQVSSESLKISESSNFEKKIEVQTENSAKKSKNDQLNKYLDPEESTQFFLSQIQTKNAEIQNLHQELKDLEERYEKNLLKFQSENEKLVVFVNELQDQLQTLKMIHEKCKEKHQEFQENIEKYKKNLKILHENNSKLENAVKRLKSEAEIKEKIKENQAEDLAEAIFDKVGSYEDKKILQACLCKIWNANFEVLEVRFKQDLLKRIFGDGFEEFFLISQNRIKSLQAEIRNYELLLFEKKIEKKTQKRLDREKREQKLGKRVSFSGFEYESSPSPKKDSKNPDYKKISEITSTDLLNFLQCSASLLEELSWNQ